MSPSPALGGTTVIKLATASRVWCKVHGLVLGIYHTCTAGANVVSTRLRAKCELSAFLARVRSTNAAQC
jgi:hypothetical protein